MSKNIVFSDFSPRGYFIEYPLFFNYFLNTYVELHQSDFKYNKDNKTFVLKKLYSNKALESFICSEIQSLIDSLSLNNSVHSQIFIIADSGDLRKEKYQMLESDIDIHIKQLEKVAKILFNKFFTKKISIHNHKAIWCKHNNLTAENWKDICKRLIFGEKNFEFVKLNCNKEIVKEKTIDIEISKEENNLIVANVVSWLKEELSKII